MHEFSPLYACDVHLLRAHGDMVVRNIMVTGSCACSIYVPVHAVTDLLLCLCTTTAENWMLQFDTQTMPDFPKKASMGPANCTQANTHVSRLACARNNPHWTAAHVQIENRTGEGDEEN